MFGESKYSVIRQLLSLKKVLSLKDELKPEEDNGYSWFEIVSRIGYNTEEVYILCKALYLLENEMENEIESYSHQEINKLIETVKNINC